MQCRWRMPFENMIYIGDNLKKDFMAPKQLGMQWIWVNNEQGIYRTQGKCKNMVNAVSDIEKLLN